MSHPFQPRSVLAGCGVALMLALGVLLHSSPAAAQGLPTTGCYAAIDGEIYSEGNIYFALGNNSCAAPNGSDGGTDRWDTTAFVGLSFPIGESFNPHLSAGIRHTNVGASNFVYGGEISASISLIKGLQDARVRLIGLAGNANALGVGLLGNAGIGWDVGAESLLMTAGLQAPHARLLLDFAIDDISLRAFLEANSYGKIGAICGAGTVLADGAGILQLWADVMGATDVEGDIFSGSFDWYGPELFSGTPSSAFSGGETCYKVGSIG